MGNGMAPCRAGPSGGQNSKASRVTYHYPTAPAPRYTPWLVAPLKTPTLDGTLTTSCYIPLYIYKRCCIQSAIVHHVAQVRDGPIAVCISALIGAHRLYFALHHGRHRRPHKKMEDVARMRRPFLDLKPAEPLQGLVQTGRRTKCKL